MTRHQMLKSEEVPLIRTNTIAGVRSWFNSLENRNLMWHMDDDARGVNWSAFNVVPPVSSNLLESQRLLAHKICEAHGFSIWDIMSSIKNLREFLETRRYESGPTIEELCLHPRHDCMTQLLLYGPGTDELYDLTDCQIRKLTYLEWIPPADGSSSRFDQSFDNPDFMRYTGYWTNRSSGSAHPPDKLREAEILLYRNWCHDKR